MVQSLMSFYDVVFPLNIGPLTYFWPSERGVMKPGTLVRAEVRKSLQYGIVVREATERPVGAVKDIHDIVLPEPAIGTALLDLLKWMAEYYLAPEGMVLKGMALMEYVEKLKARSQRGGRAEEARPHMLLPESSANVVSSVRASLAKKEYAAYLFQAATTLHEISSVLHILQETRNCVVLVPEMAHIELLEPIVREAFGERLSVLHGKLSNLKRRAEIHRILSGGADIVMGTRLAVFAPLSSVSFISVIEEQNRSYKNLEGVRYHARDVAVMRGYLEKSTVLLSSVSPSLESYQNTVKGKYRLLMLEGTMKRPRVEIVNMKTSAAVTPYLSKRAIQAASSYVSRGENALFLVNRKGYAMIQCGDCGTIEKCPECRLPLVYHRSKMLLKCHSCNYTSTATDSCRQCHGSRLGMVGAGTERIVADVKKYLGVAPLRIDRDALREEKDLRNIGNLIQEEEIVVGTKAVAGRLRQREGYKLCVFLNPDISLHMPDFRSSELLFQEICSISQYVKPEGMVMIQTRMPGNDVFRFIKKYNLEGFSREELSRREALSYPPFSRIIVVTVSAKTDVSGKLLNALVLPDKEIECIGPLLLRKGRSHSSRIFLKSRAKEKLHLYAKRLLGNLRGEKGLRIVVDVDPIAL